MKIHMDIECTPDEARTLFGLPDVKPMQEALMKDVEARMKKTLSAMEPESLVRMWLPAGIKGIEQWQDFVWSSVQRALSKARGDGGDEDAKGEAK